MGAQREHNRTRSVCRPTLRGEIRRTAVGLTGGAVERRWGAAWCALVLSAVVAVGGAEPAAALTASAFTDGAEPWTASGCAGDVPVVVGSDADAQSDIYSAVTLAGAIGTDCVVLAGPRDGGMPASQRARLDAAAAGGYIVGGIAAVPAAKTAGRTMIRVAGADRWATAQLVGSEARSLSGGGASAAPAPDGSLTAPDDVQQPGVHLRGAEPWIASDCAGDVPVVAGSDANAQSDIYSAVTLAGAIGTDCVILAGPRGGSMPTSQRARLDAANKGGFAVGGVAAVPTAKITGRDMTRLAGTDRWATAQLVGRRASGDTTAGEPIDNAETSASDNYTAVSVGTSHSCGLRTDGAVECWGHNEHGEAVAPSGKFTSISAGRRHSCGLRTDGAVECWGHNNSGRTDAPSGKFTSISAGGSHSCGLRTSGAVDCWGWN
ncbi:MAG: hypothetical protein F4242_04360, partial [Acidimicrobiales bacterium]|nr:hypothetical protein [Acidimicrobiales bacterium]